ncbi:hypothetical protein ALQ78_101676 [Pseudomonas syringae pv. aptata]|nr:Unknown protein sequence [Pseudomonas syringae pv. syringae]RMM48293.1 hypothetical protein ALQ78_101676 [Pseudomonas syringae pv. aptata]RMN43478.1 hypothetical protein ALQ60_102101 [Pseudomonas syringae pv. papulans]RMS21627.1 hypothetical protein ALP69_102152 [Pseudomonas syringae pv. aceris]RML74213.1 hypothetical protein ALQ91_102290 [Pseudomonas syringae pv. syringae]
MIRTPYQRFMTVSYQPKSRRRGNGHSVSRHTTITKASQA